nr:hypothetical protein [Luteibacter rhizovicinus]
MTHISSKLALAIGLAFAGWQTTVLAQSSSATLFDGYVAAGLPQAFALPRPADDERGEGIDQVVIEEKLDTDVVFPDGSHAMTYVGTSNGIEATFTRIGDDLSVSVSDERLEPTVSTGRIRRSAAPEMNDAITLPPSASTRAFSLTAEPQTQAPRELQFWIFLHDQSGETNYAKFHNWYIAWWIRDMEHAVKPGIPVKVIIKDHIPGVTDFDYHQAVTSDRSLVKFGNIADRYLDSAGATPSQITKTMLFVNDVAANWGDYTYGVALQNNTVAMASGTGPRHIVAHEFGHTLGAAHRYAEDRFPCVTNMMGFITPRYSCRIYTGANDLEIRRHVKEALEAIERER